MIRIIDVTSSKMVVEKSTAKSAGKISWLVRLMTFCSEASVVGLRYVANTSASLFRRTVWVLLLLAGTAFTTHNILSSIAYYFTYPTNVNIRVQYEQEMRFPTVTICNENAITLSGASSLGKLRYSHKCYVLSFKQEMSSFICSYIIIQQ